jgi:hypothetical protein
MVATGGGAAAGVEGAQEGEQIRFKMLMKRGGKDDKTRELQVGRLPGQHHACSLSVGRRGAPGAPRQPFSAPSSAAPSPCRPARHLQVPASASLAVRLKQREDAEAEERASIKALVLEANKREQMEQVEALRRGGYRRPGYRR